MFCALVAGGVIKTFCLSLYDVTFTKHNDARTLNTVVQGLEDECRGGLMGQELRNEEGKI
jgi:hypothetical protein